LPLTSGKWTWNTKVGIQIEIIKKEKNGCKVFEDEFQVVAIPHGKDKSEVL